MNDKIDLAVADKMNLQMAQLSYRVEALTKEITDSKKTITAMTKALVGIYSMERARDDFKDVPIPLALAINIRENLDEHKAINLKLQNSKSQFPYGG